MTTLQYLIVLIEHNSFFFIYGKPGAGRKGGCLTGIEAEYCDILRDVTQHSEGKHSPRWMKLAPAGLDPIEALRYE
jgi:hypothetical protein